jgi:hypothetical protein
MRAVRRELDLRAVLGRLAGGAAVLAKRGESAPRSGEEGVRADDAVKRCDPAL